MKTNTETPPFPLDHKLQALKAALDLREKQFLSPLACLSRDALRRIPETRPDHRQAFSLDTDRILHARAYTRYIDKTQVFSLIENDHITHRVLHVQLVSKIGRTIGRFLGLNEDLIEAIALGHDIGHPPFGHDGEHFLSALCEAHGLPPFQHNIQSIQFLDRIERQGRGWNLTLQTLDGILCHDGEIHNQNLRPVRESTFAAFDAKIVRKNAQTTAELRPMTLEGCVVRLADTIGYIGRDIEDAIVLKLIDRADIPGSCQEILGNTNGSIVYTLVTDLLATGVQKDSIGFSPQISVALRELKAFNYERIYRNPAIKKGFETIEACYEVVFETLLEDLLAGRRQSPIFREFLDTMGSGYGEDHPPAAIVRDFIAGMTDDYFVNQARLLDCHVATEKMGQN